MESPNLSIKVFVLIWHTAYFKGFGKQELGFRPSSEKSQLHDLLQVHQTFLVSVFAFLIEGAGRHMESQKHLQMSTGNIN